MVVPLRFGNSGVFPRGFTLAMGFMAVARAGVEGWDERLADTFSGRLKQIHVELAALAPQLDTLPGIPIDDQGGTGGYASIHPHAAPARDSTCAVEVLWPASARVDLVALVPARRYDARGLDAQYGMPDAFTVELINDQRRGAGMRGPRAEREHPSGARGPSVCLSGFAADRGGGIEDFRRAAATRPRRGG